LARHAAAAGRHHETANLVRKAPSLSQRVIDAPLKLEAFL
jgi:hypothetical protein